MDLYIIGRFRLTATQTLTNKSTKNSSWYNIVVYGIFHSGLVHANGDNPHSIPSPENYVLN
jgi:hypothetical protein